MLPNGCIYLIKNLDQQGTLRECDENFSWLSKGVLFHLPHSSYKILRKGSRHQILVFILIGKCRADTLSFHKTVWVHPLMKLSSLEYVYCIKDLLMKEEISVRQIIFLLFSELTKNGKWICNLRKEPLKQSSFNRLKLPPISLHFCSQSYIGGTSLTPSHTKYTSKVTMNTSACITPTSQPEERCCFVLNPTCLSFSG